MFAFTPAREQSSPAVTEYTAAAAIRDRGCVPTYEDVAQDLAIRWSPGCVNASGKARRN